MTVSLKNFAGQLKTFFEAKTVVFPQVQVNGRSFPCVRELASLLLYDLPDSRAKMSTPVSKLWQKLRKAPNYVAVFGPSGCGKTRTVYELLCHKLGLYFTWGTYANGEGWRL